MQEKSYRTGRWMRRAGVVCAVMFCAALLCNSARAQEVPARTQGASLQAFGMFSYVQPHYDPSNNIGGSLGVDLNWRPLSVWQPSVEIRATFAPGADVSETTYNFGPRLEMNLGRLRPYVTGQIGTGSIHFKNPIVTPTGPYTHDSSAVYSVAFGADYMLTPQLGVRGDVMVQSWDLGDSTGTAITFHPRLYSFGVDYRFDLNALRLHRHRNE